MDYCIGLSGPHGDEALTFWERVFIADSLHFEGTGEVKNGSYQAKNGENPTMSLGSPETKIRHQYDGFEIPGLIRLLEREEQMHLYNVVDHYSSMGQNPRNPVRSILLFSKHEPESNLYRSIEPMRVIYNFDANPSSQ